MGYVSCLLSKNSRIFKSRISKYYFSANLTPFERRKTVEKKPDWALNNSVCNKILFNLPCNPDPPPDGTALPEVLWEREHPELVVTQGRGVLQGRLTRLVFRAVVHHDNLPTLHSGRVGLELEEMKYAHFLNCPIYRKNVSSINDAMTLLQAAKTNSEFLKKGNSA